MASVLDKIGVKHPGKFTTEITFIKCKHCGDINIVKDNWFVCGSCGNDLA